MVVGVRGPEGKAPIDIVSAKKDPKGEQFHEQIRISKAGSSRQRGFWRCPVWPWLKGKVTREVGWAA